jgi:hypothetical protein
MAGRFRKLGELARVQLARGRLELGTAASLFGRAGKFAAGVELFYLELLGSSLKTNRIELA